MKKPKFQAPIGMHDILGEDQKYFQKIYDVCEDIANFYNFQKIETPILEESELFSRGVGPSTDIVEKQMFSLRTKGGDLLTLRPEGTAPVVRAFIENGMRSLPQPVKIWYFSPFFRYERPQSGRFRQFWNFGFEVLGEKSPVIDAQLIQIFYNILKSLKFKNQIVEINSIGANCCRPYYKKLLSNYFKTHQTSLCNNCQRRFRENVLRILDCKGEKCQPIKSQAPQIIDHLCDECHNHFKEVLEFLDEIELPYRLNPYLVRGLDYYTKTVYEFFEDTKEGKEIGALVSGGRYDNLVKLLRGKDTPGCGGAGGVERIISLMKNKEFKFSEYSSSNVFLAQLGQKAKRKSLQIMEDFRKAKIRISESFGRDSLKAQLNRANKIGVKYTLIFGQKEAIDGTIIIRDMKTGNQEIVNIEKVVEKIRQRLKK